MNADRMVFKANPACKPKEKGFKKDDISKILTTHNDFRKKVLNGKYSKV